MIYRLGDLSLPERLSPVVSPWITQVAIAFVVVAAASVVRLGIDLILPGAAPFILMFPALLVAGLLGGQLSGMLALALGGAIAWAYVLPPVGVFKGKDTSAVISLVLYLVSGGLTVLAASAFRNSTREMIEERQSKLDERELLLSEFQHRVKNDFQIIGSILTLQRRQAAELGAEKILDQAIDRLRGVSDVHANLYAPGGDAAEVNLKDYLGRLCAALSTSLLSGSAVALVCEVAPVIMPRDRAGALGLIVNELVTNAVKHAFPDGIGEIQVRFEATHAGGRLSVSDNGIGLPADFARAQGLGRKLIAAFAAQAGGALSWTSNPGARFQLDLGA